MVEVPTEPFKGTKLFITEDNKLLQQIDVAVTSNSTLNISESLLSAMKHNISSYHLYQQTN